MNKPVTETTTTRTHHVPDPEKQQSIWDALEICGNPTQLYVWVKKAEDTGKHAFCIARNKNNTIHVILNTKFIYDTYDETQIYLEHTLRLIVRRFSDELVNENSEMLTTGIVDWIMGEIKEDRIARTENIPSKPIYLAD